jgi:ribosome-associated translation inhibitor RaiA
MQIPPQITFRGVRRTAALEKEILERLARLEKYAPRVVGGRVLVEYAGRQHQTGNGYHVRIDLSVPGEDIIVRHGASGRAATRRAARPAVRNADANDPAQKFAQVAIRKAFDAARRRLQDRVRKQRGR